MEKRLSDCYRTIDRKAFELMEQKINSITNNEYKHKTKKDELRATLIELIKKIKVERNGEDSIYNLHKQAASKIIADIERQS